MGIVNNLAVKHSKTGTKFSAKRYKSTDGNFVDVIYYWASVDVFSRTYPTAGQTLEDTVKAFGMVEVAP